MEKSLWIALLPLALIAYFLQGKIAPIKLIALGGVAMIVALGAAVAGTMMPVVQDLSATGTELFAIGIAAIGMFGILLAVPALSEIISQRRNVR